MPNSTLTASHFKQEKPVQLTLAHEQNRNTGYTFTASHFKQEKPVQLILAQHLNKNWVQDCF